MVVFLSSLTVPFTPPFNKRSHHPISVSVSSSSSPSTNQENPNFVAHQNVTLRDICQAHVPHHILRRVEEVGYLTPTEIQRQALPVLFSRRDCILHAQTGSGKTLAYLLLIYSVVNTQRSSVQALIVVPTRELGMQVAKVARMLAAKADQPELENKACTIMALLDGGTLKRQKSWLKAEPPTIIVGTLGSLCQMLEKQMIKLESMRVLVIDEVDFMFNSSSQVSSLRKLLISYSSINNRQTIFASASIPQHRRFLYDCIQQKWTKADVVHIHANPVQPMPARLQHRFLSEKSKKAGNAPATSVVIDVLKNSHKGSHEILLLEEKLNFNSRAASFSELRQGGSYLLVATDIAGRGVDLPDTTHIYNFDLPKDAVHYLHRAGRTGRKPFSENKCVVTSIITSEERFVLQRYENELMFVCDELFL
ncbi:DEAD-box ATP-dependent RNA helicase 58, chloroplastic isoform X2 [Helianthus annuus]|uniref:DEAD-box ATP-dependent RNA helicase 58, chloroplastic isoform X2 n=1 Tax=Helianthus annuus TaxID=4232 RepID=UPI000B9028ED|nr:DEAD-box ATP-dependent RNA helicase 58, chloroplastic isoform X2 [Helianthus annuus]